MKTSIFKFKYLALVLVFIFSTACSKDDDSPKISTPTVTYPSSTIEIPFFEAGSSAAPDITWNGNQGNFSLATSLEGLSIDGNTGVLSWTKLLPAGKHSIQVVITNSAGQKSMNLTLDNRLEGNFSYKFQGSCSYELQFMKDGALTVKNIGGTEVIADGSWEMNGMEVIGNYTFTEDNTQQSIKGVLKQTTTDVKLEGDWYDEVGAIAGQEGGSIDLKLGKLPAGDGIIAKTDDGRYRIIYYGYCNAGSCCYSSIQAAKDSSTRTLTFVP